MDNIFNNQTNKGIYKITCLSNKKFYIGSSTNIQRRIQRHFKELEQNIHLNGYMQASFNKYGKCSFIVECVESCSKEITDKDLLNLEQKYLDNLKPYNEDIGFNICQKAAFPPNRKGKKLTEEHKQNISKARKGITHKQVSPLKGKTAQEIHGQDWIDPRKGKTAKEICGNDWVDSRKGKTYKEIYGLDWKKQSEKLSKARRGKTYRTDLLTFLNVKTNTITTKTFKEWCELNVAIYHLTKQKIKTSKGWALYNSGKLP